MDFRKEVGLSKVVASGKETHSWLDSDEIGLWVADGALTSAQSLYASTQLQFWHCRSLLNSPLFKAVISQVTSFCIAQLNNAV